MLEAAQGHESFLIEHTHPEALSPPGQFGIPLMYVVLFWLELQPAQAFYPGIIKCSNPALN